MLAGERRAGGDLVQKWLKKMEVAPIDQRQIDWSRAEPFGGIEPAKPTPDDDDARALLHAVHRKKNNGKIVVPITTDLAILAIQHGETPP